MPAALTASYAAGGARKWNSFGSATPRDVTGVSRLTMARSALPSSAEIGPNAVVGSLSNARVRPSKCESPAKSSTISGGAVGVTDAVREALALGGVQDAVAPHPVSATSAATATSALPSLAVTPDSVRPAMTLNGCGCQGNHERSLPAGR